MMKKPQPRQNSRRELWGASALSILLGTTLCSAASAAYQVVDLGANVSPTDINYDGVVVGTRNTDQYPTVAFRYTAAGGVEDLAVGTQANAVNDNGQIVGNSLSGAFLIDGKTVREWVGYGAYGLNVSGQISGNKDMRNPYRPTPLPLAPAVYNGKRWEVMDIAQVYPRGTQKGVYADLYVLSGINNQGNAVGRKSRYGLAGSSAILIKPPYSKVRSAADVIYLPIPNGGYASAINNQNMIVGATGNNSTTNSYSHAFLYDYDGGVLHDLGTLVNADGKNGLRSSASDINEWNQVVGSSWLVATNTSLNDPTQYHAFLWEDGQMIDLNSEIPGGSDWNLTAAVAINDSGDIVGTGLRPGASGELVTHGFLMLWTPD